MSDDWYEKHERSRFCLTVELLSDTLSGLVAELGTIAEHVTIASPTPEPRGYKTLRLIDGANFGSPVAFGKWELYDTGDPAGASKVDVSDGVSKDFGLGGQA